MVKTRRQSNQPEDNSPPKQVHRVAANKTRKVRRNMVINKQMMRERLKAKLVKGCRQPACIGRKYIDINNQEFQSIIGVQKFNCPICLETMIFPVLTHCGHAFCLPCLEQSLKHKNVCSLCRQPISYQHFRQSKIIEKLIAKVQSRVMDEEQVNQFKEKDKQRKIDSEIKVGDFIDFYSNRSWTQGTVLQIDNRGIEPILKIEPTQRQTKVYEFNLGSRLIARHRYFTKENTLFRDLMGQFRLQISGLGELPIFQNLIDVEINPIRSQIFEDGTQELIRFTFSIQP